METLSDYILELIFDHLPHQTIRRLTLVNHRLRRIGMGGYWTRRAQKQFHHRHLLEPMTCRRYTEIAFFEALGERFDGTLMELGQTYQSWGDNHRASYSRFLGGYGLPSNLSPLYPRAIVPSPYYLLLGAFEQDNLDAMIWFLSQRPWDGVERAIELLDFGVVEMVARIMHKRRQPIPSHLTLIGVRSRSLRLVSILFPCEGEWDAAFIESVRLNLPEIFEYFLESGFRGRAKTKYVIYRASLVASEGPIRQRLKGLLGL